MSDSEFKNPYPEEFGYLRIGTPVNVNINRANPDYPAFDMGKLAAAGLLLTDVNTTSEHKIQGGGYDSKSQEAWGYSVSAQAGLNLGFINASLEFHLNQSSNTALNSNGQYLSAWARQTSGIKLRLNATEDEILSCATGDFHEKICAIRQAGDAATLTAKLAEFYARYGTGFVSELELGAMGVFRGSASYQSQAVETKLNTGGSVSVGAALGGASVAVDYAAQHMKSDAAGSFETRSFGMPDNSGAAIWAQGFESQFAGAQISKIMSLDAWTKGFDAPLAKAEKPDLPKKEPSKDPLPAYKIQTLDDAVKQMKIDNWREEWKKNHGGQEPAADEYAKYVDTLKSAARLSDDSINDGKSRVTANLQNTGMRAATPGTANVGPGYFHDPATRVSGPGNRPGAGDPVSDVNFGGYGVTGYRYLPWSAILPKFKEIEEMLTLSQVIMGYSMVWLSIRTLFWQYFQFCSQFPEIAPAEMTKVAICFGKAIRDMAEYITGSLAAGKYDGNFLKTLDDTFRNYLLENGLSQEQLVYYDLLILHYYWLKKVPFGVVPLVKQGDRYFYQNLNNQIIEVEEIADPGPEMVAAGACRMYPVLSKQAAYNHYFIWISNAPEPGAYTLINPSSRYDSLKGDPFNYMDELKDLSGFLREAGMFCPASLTDIKTRSRSEDNILPWSSTVDKKVWTPIPLQHSGKLDCLVFTFQGGQTKYYLAGPGKEVTIPDLYVKLASLKCEHAEVLLVPVDYGTVELSGKTEIAGGSPMWYETGMEKLLKKLHDLAD